MNRKQEWLTAIEQYYRQEGNMGGSIILFPGYQPELCMMLSAHLDMEFFDYRKEEMQAFGHQADSIDLTHLDNALRTHSKTKSIFSHNVEALLCVKTKQERRDWLQSFLDADWPNPIFLPIAIFQDDVPEEHPRVCDFELMKMPKHSLTIASQTENHMKYDLEAMKN